MSEASIRTIAWREQKRQEGYQPVTIWIPAPVKNAMVNLSFQRHQDLGELIVEAFQAWVPAKGGGGMPYVGERRIAEMIDRKISEALASQGAPAEAVPREPPALPTPSIAGMRWCKAGLHQYPGRGPCRQCANIRKQRSRSKLAAAKQGVVPAP
jgi:hypothetical protein